MKMFQITQIFGESGLGFKYFDMPDGSTEDEIKAKAIEVQKEDYENRFSGFFGFSGKPREKSTIKIKEYLDGKVVKGGIKLKTKWR